MVTVRPEEERAEIKSDTPLTVGATDTSSDCTMTERDNDSSMEPRSLAFSSECSDEGERSAGFGQPQQTQQQRGMADAEGATSASAVTSAAYPGSAFASAVGGGSAESSEEEPVKATIVSTSNQLEEEPWMPVRGIITMFRIQVSTGDKQWDVMRRYTDFNELHLQLTRAVDPSIVPPLPPKLLLNDDTSIAERCALDSAIRQRCRARSLLHLLCPPACGSRVHTFQPLPQLISRR